MYQLFCTTALGPPAWQLTSEIAAQLVRRLSTGSKPALPETVTLMLTVYEDCTKNMYLRPGPPLNPSAWPCDLPKSLNHWNDPPGSWMIAVSWMGHWSSVGQP